MGVMKGKLTKLESLVIKYESEHDGLRTGEVEGEFLELPRSGQRFLLFAKALDPKKLIRYVSTSQVQECRRVNDKLIQFRTLYSKYKLEIQDDG